MSRSSSHSRSASGICLKGLKKAIRPRAIRRAKVLTALAVSSALAAPLAGCYSEGDIMGPVPQVTPDERTANSTTKAVFFRTAEECRTNLAEREKRGLPRLSISPDDCEAQLFAAQKEYGATVPIFNSAQDCQRDKVKCEPTEGGYRPIFGGAYIYPSSGHYLPIFMGGTERRVYVPSTVYSGARPGQYVTPYGRSITQHYVGSVEVPRHTQFTAPARPAAVQGTGLISGRGQSGFGSTYKATGRGGFGK